MDTGLYPELRFLKSYNLEWLQYVTDSRKDGDKYRLYELVEGGVATDIVIDTVADTCFHKNGVLSLWKAPQCVYSPLFRAISLKHQPIQHQP